MPDRGPLRSDGVEDGHNVLGPLSQVGMALRESI